MMVDAACDCCGGHMRIDEDDWEETCVCDCCGAVVEAPDGWEEGGEALCLDCYDEWEMGCRIEGRFGYCYPQ